MALHHYGDFRVEVFYFDSPSITLRKSSKMGATIHVSDFKAKMSQLRFPLGLCPRPYWRSLQCSHRPLSCIYL